jgi:hypothetical protein
MNGLVKKNGRRGGEVFLLTLFDDAKKRREGEGVLQYKEVFFGKVFFLFLYLGVKKKLWEGGMDS